MKGVTPSAPLYPTLSAETAEPDQSYRLQEISRVRTQLEAERDRRAALYKKYHRGVNTLDGVDAALVTASLGLGVGGIGLLSTIVAAPLVVGMEAAALGCGVLGVAGKFISRRLAVKAKKHDEIRILAESKLNTISDHVSTALLDGRISDDEFRLVVAELEKFQLMRAEIRAGAQQKHGAVTVDEAAKNALIQQGREEARASFIKKLGVE